MLNESADNTKQRVLATDLDGTLIPLPGNPDNRVDLETLRACIAKHGLELIYVTGRHLASVLAAIHEHQLPTPDWIICDVGSSVYQRDSRDTFASVDKYRELLGSLIQACPIDQLKELLADLPELQLQESEKQGTFKLSYYTDASVLSDVSGRIREKLARLQAPYSLIDSVDPFNGQGLIDLLPRDVSKQFALRWWSRHRQVAYERIVFAGDSGNDWAALTSGCRAILVGNASRELATRVEAACRDHDTVCLYLAQGHATSGVLEGCRWFNLVE